jgi:hypothetical protein
MTMSRTDKEARLKDFIASALIARGEDPARDGRVTLFVRSPDSPVARALVAAHSEGLMPAATVRIVMCDTNSEEAGAPSVLDLAGVEVRVLAEASFAHAHEQMTIGPVYSWIGDCLRRDPAKRDAFELFHPADAKVALFATASFEKLWQRARPMKLAPADLLSPEIIAAQADDVALATPPRH